jgi:hypothetical protein
MSLLRTARVRPVVVDEGLGCIAAVAVVFDGAEINRGSPPQVLGR